MDNRHWKKIGIGVLIVLIVLLALRVIFDEKFDDFDRMIEARENHPGGEEEFDRNFENMVQWIEQYKRDHPDATDAEVDAAFEAGIKGFER